MRPVSDPIMKQTIRAEIPVSLRVFGNVANCVSRRSKDDRVAGSLYVPSLSQIGIKSARFEVDSSVEQAPVLLSTHPFESSSPNALNSKMFARSFAAILLVLPALAAASALPQNDGFTSNNIRPNAGNQPAMVDQCNTGALQCCNETQTVSYFATSPSSQPSF